ncbi:Gfo/Idh/MocA family protein [Chloroflexota bacterium]
MAREHKNLGAIGTGSVFKRFADGIREVEQDKVRVEFTAVADVKTAEEVGQLIKDNYRYYQIPRQWAENPDPENLPIQMREFLEQVDAVYIASTNNTHRGYILSALNQGKDVICTKPLTESLGTARYLRDALGKKGISSGRGEPGKIKFMYEDHYLYQSISIELFDKLIPEANPFDDNELGKVQSVSGFFLEKRGASRIEPARAGWLFNPEISGGGVWIDIGIHLVTILHKLGARFEIVSAHPRIDSGFEAEMQMTVHARIAPDAVAQQPVIWNRTPLYLAVEKEAEQTRKELIFYFERGSVSLNFNRGEIHRIIGGQQPDVLSKKPVNAFKNVAKIFSRLITGQGDRRLVSLSDAVKDMEVIEEVYRQAGLKGEGES